MLYAKKDIYGMDGEVRRLIAPAGQPVPRLFEKLVDKDDVSETPVKAKEPIVEPAVEEKQPVKRPAKKAE